METRSKPDNETTFRRDFTVSTEERKIDTEKRTVTLPFSSELPVKRSYGMEILDHTAEAADFARLNNGAAVLEDHWSRQIGVVEAA